MSFHELTDEQREIRDLARRFADEAIAPRAATWDREHRFPREVFTQLGEIGLMGACVPSEYGGAGADFLAYVLALEELARGDAGVAVTVAVHVSAATLPLLTHGSPEQVERLVLPLARGDEIGAFALTESGGGSDARAMRTRADEDGRLTGSKQWITNGSYAKVRILLHPPLLRAMGLERKLRLGPWVFPLLRLLYRMRRLRGTRLDPFGAAHVRCVERELVQEYRGLVNGALAHLEAGNAAIVAELADLPDIVRGYEEIKLRAVERFRVRASDLKSRLSDDSSSSATLAVTHVTGVR